ncbi:MAG: hypothetical protein AAB468_02020 [Patescibacteria group bacterium]
MFTDESRITMSIRFEGVSPEELLAIHKIADESEPATRDAHAKKGFEHKIAEISRAVFEAPSNTYLVQLSVSTFFHGHEFWTGMKQRQITVTPSRECLGRIFDALGILPEKEVVK